MTLDGASFVPRCGSSDPGELEQRKIWPGQFGPRQQATLRHVSVVLSRRGQ
jgi:hypothetical protein